MDNGRIHVYYGDGKGKTTCSLGLAIRAVGAKKRVAFVQFDKGFAEGNEHYSERAVLRTIEFISFFPTGCERMLPDDKFRFGVTDDDLREAKRGLALGESAIQDGRYYLVVLDEILSALSYGMVTEADVKKVIAAWDRKPLSELVMTGRALPSWLEEKADLVTEFRKVKHYFDKGIPAKLGIEY